MKTRNKGYRNEYLLAQRLIEMGFKGERVPLSGQGWGQGDLRFKFGSKYRTCEVKAYSSKFFEYDLLDKSDIVFKRTTGNQCSKDWLVIMPIKLFAELVT